MRMLLIAGGWSSERAVSLMGARNIEAALKKLGHQVRFLDPALEFSRILPEALQHEFAFINLHGAPGEDGLIQAMLDSAGCPYQGAGPRPSFLSLNKAAAKEIYASVGLRTPAWQLFCGVEEEAPLQLDLPLFIKPNTGGSSLGMALVREVSELAPALKTVFDMGQVALAETYVPGVELTCAVLDDRALPLIMIRPKPGTVFFDYDNKYDADGAQEICPAPVDETLAEDVQNMALQAHRALGIECYSRSDFMVDAAGKPWILETNTLPGMTATSLLPKAAAVVGLCFEELVAELVRLGLQARQNRF